METEEPTKNELTCDHREACDTYRCCPCPDWTPKIDRGGLANIAEALEHSANEIERQLSGKKWPKYAAMHRRQCINAAKAIRECIDYDYRKYWPY